VLECSKKDIFFFLKKKKKIVLITKFFQIKIANKSKKIENCTKLNIVFKNTEMLNVSWTLVKKL